MAAITALLDLTWLAGAAACLVSLLAFEIRQRQRKGRANRVVGGLLSLVVLFPCVSASDDLMGLAFLPPRTDRQDETSLLIASESPEGPDFELGVRLLALDHFQATSPDPIPETSHFMGRFSTTIPVFAAFAPHRHASRAPPSV